MSNTFYLDECFEDIVDKVIELLELEIVQGGELENVKSVVRGDRARNRPDLPCLWVFPQQARAEIDTGLTEKWFLPLVFISIVKNHDVELGYREANKIALKARKIIIKNKTLGLRDFVRHTRSTQFQPSGQWQDDKTLFSSGATVEVEFRIREV